MVSSICHYGGGGSEDEDVLPSFEQQLLDVGKAYERLRTGSSGGLVMERSEGV